jgi:hypothetical protein
MIANVMSAIGHRVVPRRCGIWLLSGHGGHRSDRPSSIVSTDPGNPAVRAIRRIDSPVHFRGFIESESRKWAKVIKDAGLQTTK